MSLHPTTTVADGETDSQVTVGVPMFSRERALAQFLASVPRDVARVVVADNGADTDRAVYDESWPFELDVLELPYDCGIGTCRARLVDATDTEYLWLGDCDMQLLGERDLSRLQTILDARPSLGGVSGWLVEARGVRSGARNLVRSGDTLVKQAPASVDIEWSPLPFARFEFIPQAGLFRRSCFETYSYDDSLDASEHLDFFLGHKQAGEWEFASTPAVLTAHHRHIDPEYRQSRRGRNHADYDVLAEKWGIADSAPGWRSDWAQQRSDSLVDHAFSVLKRVTPPRVWLPMKRAGEVVLR